MIVAERREGFVAAPVDSRAGYAPLWRSLDRNLPLAVKLLGPVVIITALAIVLGAFIVVGQTQRSTEAAYAADARAAGAGAATEFAAIGGQAQDMSAFLAHEVADEANVTGIWIVETWHPGLIVVASSNSGEIGTSGIVATKYISRVVNGESFTTHETFRGQPVLETFEAVNYQPYAVLVVTSLGNEASLVDQTILWIAAAGAGAGLLEVAGLGLILEFGILRRMRRIQLAIDSYDRGRHRARLSEGEEPAGRDVVFNLARDIDHKLTELDERQRSGDIISDLGLSSLQGATPEELISKALELVRRTVGLERCFLVDTSGAEVMVTDFDEHGRRTPAAALPIWLGALVRAAARARRPVLADGLGDGCRFWDAHAESRDAVAAFVPLAGTPDPIGVMVGMAVSGAHINGPAVNLMEGVATTLGETLQRSAADKARRESEVKSRALSTVSHEIRNPLNAMLGFTNVLLAGDAGPLNEKQQEYLKRVDEASHHLLNLVNDYLDLARIMAGSMPVVIESVRVEPEVKSVFDLIGPTAQAKNVQLHYDVAPNAVALVDRLRLRQVLINLVSNAIKFTPARGHVRVEVGGGSNGVRISVIDTGIGIPADRQHLIFTEFAQLHRGDAVEGSGLGLVLTKRFVEAMGGFIRFTSSEGAGTIFDVWLPGELASTSKTIAMAAASA